MATKKQPPMSDLVDFMRESRANDPKKVRLQDAVAGKPVAPEPQPAGVTSSISGTSTDPRQTPFVKTANLQAIDDKPPANPNAGTNEALYKSIIAAVPTLIGAAFGNKGGAIGAQAGTKAVSDYTDQKKTDLATAQLAEKDRYDRGVQAQKLSNEAERIGIAQQQVDQTKGLKEETAKARKDNASARLDLAQREEIRKFQNDFNKDKQVAAASESHKVIGELEGLIKRGDGQSAQAIKFSLAKLYNGGRPTEPDVQAFGGSTEWLNKLEQAWKMKTDDKEGLTPTNKEVYRGLINILKVSANKTMDKYATRYSAQAGKRFKRSTDEMKELLSLDLGEAPGAEDDAGKQADIDAILGGS